MPGDSGGKGGNANVSRFFIVPTFIVLWIEITDCFISVQSKVMQYKKARDESSRHQWQSST